MQLVENNILPIVTFTVLTTTVTASTTITPFGV